jgi:histidine phosphotransfer protein HptB
MDIKAHSERIGLDVAEYLEMLEIFLESGGNDLQALEAAVAGNNAGQTHSASHSLKGSSGSLGLEEIHLLAKDIDDRARKGTLDGVAESTARIRAEFEMLAAEVARLVRTP